MDVTNFQKTTGAEKVWRQPWLSFSLLCTINTDGTGDDLAMISVPADSHRQLYNYCVEYQIFDQLMDFKLIKS